MSEKGLWNNDWLDAQRKFWQDWTDTSSAALAGRQSAANPWEGALDQWWQAVSPAAPAASREFLERIMDQGRNFLRITDELTRNLGSGAQAAGDWNSALEKTFSNLQQGFGAAPDGDDAWHKVMAFWEMPFDNWQRMVSSLSLTPGDALRNMPHDQVKESLNRFLSAPGLGYTREEQSQYQDLIRRSVDYQKALQEYLQFFSNLGFLSVERMRKTMEKLRSGDKRIDSARGLYDTWVGCCEAVYAEQVMTPEYARIHGKMVNALMALKHRMTVMVDESLGSMNMPTRSELRTLQDRLQETRRENKALRREIDAIKAELSAPAARTPRSPSSPRKAPVRRKTTTKKAATKTAE
jgi:class III poly(R)-hydroxyalkanoic acid synthase PhaE subunit